MDETSGTISNIQDSSRKYFGFHPLEEAKTRCILQLRQKSLADVKTETSSDNEASNESSSSNEDRKRKREKVTAFRLIYSNDENDSEDSECSPEISSSNKEDSSDSWTDDWTPKRSTKKRKKDEKRKKVLRGNALHKPKPSQVTNKSTESQQCDFTNQCCVREEDNKTFEIKKGLFLHIKLHLSKKPYACSSCDKTFASSSNLQKHVRVHTQEKPYSRTICDRRFADGSNMRKHIEMHGAPHVSNGCDEELQHSIGLETNDIMHNNCSMCGNDGRVSSCECSQESNATADSEDQCYEYKDCSTNVNVAFEKHVKFHKICKSLQCVIFDKQFCSANDLLRHEARLPGKVHKGQNVDNKTKTNNGKEISIIIASSENHPQNCALPIHVNKSAEVNEKILFESQKPIACNESEHLPTALIQQKEFNEACMPITKHNGLPILLSTQKNAEEVRMLGINQNKLAVLEQYDTETEIETLSPFLEGQTQVTSWENEKPCFSLQQSVNVEFENKNSSTSLGFQKSVVDEQQLDLRDKENCENVLNEYHQLLVNMIDREENTQESRNIFQLEQKMESVLDKHEPNVPVLGRIHSVFPNNVFCEKLDPSPNSCISCEIAHKNEEDTMNSLGIFFES